MPNEPKPKDLGSVWRDQPVEKLEVSLNRFMERRSRELETKTRWEIVTSIVATLFFVAVFWWRLPGMQSWPQQLGFVLVISWVLLSAYWFRGRIWPRVPAQPEAVTSVGIEFYRRQLQGRRDHLRNAWVWYGPVLLACVITAAVLGREALARPGRLWNIAPFVLMLLAWVALGWRLRRRQAKQIQQEIDELSDT